jgi:hypothetical protein
MVQFTRVALISCQVLQDTLITMAVFVVQSDEGLTQRRPIMGERWEQH